MSCIEFESKNLGRSFQLEIGSIIENHYRIDGILGNDTLASVYSCSPIGRPEEKKALKVLQSEYMNDDIVAERFRRESILSLTVSHPNVIRVEDFFQSESFMAYLMEYAEGGDLRSVIDNHMILAHERSVKICKEICQGLRAIHERGIVHRDIKPENILFAGDGSAKLSDFGIANIDEGRRLTQHGNLLCTIAYVSPEYVSSGECDERADIYGLGLVAYEMLTGNLPFSECESPMEALTARLRGTPTQPYSIRTDCPVSFNAWVMKALQSNPDDRFQTATEMLEALEPVFDELGSTRIDIIDDARKELKQRPSLIERVIGVTDDSREVMLEAKTFSRVDMRIMRDRISHKKLDQSESRARGFQYALAIMLVCTMISASSFFVYSTIQRSSVQSDQEQIRTPVKKLAVASVRSIPILDSETRLEVQRAMARVGLPVDVPILKAAAPNLLDNGMKIRRYQLVSGDTLSKIARKFGVPVRILMETNNIENPNNLDVGLELIVPGIDG